MDRTERKRRRTVQRDAIRRVVCGYRWHPTAKDVYEEVSETLPDISMGTVYRNLSVLCETGEVARLAGDGEARFDGETTPHPHVRCVSCGAVADVAAQPGGVSLPKAADVAGYRVLGYSLEYRGLCPACQEKGEAHG